MSVTASCAGSVMASERRRLRSGRRGDRQAPHWLAREEKVVWDKGLKSRDHRQKSINELARQMKAEPENEGLRETRLRYQREFDEINDKLPKRYQATLKNRLWEDGPDGGA